MSGWSQIYCSISWAYFVYICWYLTDHFRKRAKRQKHTYEPRCWRNQRWVRVPTPNQVLFVHLIYVQECRCLGDLWKSKTGTDTQTLLISSGHSVGVELQTAVHAATHNLSVPSSPSVNKTDHCGADVTWVLDRLQNSNGMAAVIVPGLETTVYLVFSAMILKS